tara:strand:- start:1337 stop:2950 length:1614 start_codon:yes stop_codon:yes gene_type:complete
MISKAKRFRDLLESEKLEFICEAHNGISAKIVEEAGFKGIWGSGLTISAQYGVRDNNEASWTQVLDNLEFMSDASEIPILLDGDTGYGNFNNFQRLVQKLEQRDIAAVCIEDKIFPKTNSFISGEKQQLADIQEFSGKISAGKDAQSDDDFSIIARVEAFIAGWGLEEAIKRASAYHEAGADGILIHSALNKPDEILAFKKEWGDRCPVVIVPTKYYATPTELFDENNISLIIWANHILRTSITSMQQTAKMIFEEENLHSIEDQVASVSEIFRLQGASDLQDSEDKYLPTNSTGTTAVILAASRGKELGDLTKEKPKAMVEVAGKPIISRIVNSYNDSGIKSICVVRGYKPESFNLPNIAYCDNKKFEETGEVFSLLQALEQVDPDQDLIISYGDVLFKKYVSLMLLEESSDISLVVDTNWKQNINPERESDYVRCNQRSDRSSLGNSIELETIGIDLSSEIIDGEWMGMIKIKKELRKDLYKLVKDLLDNSSDKATMPDLIKLFKQSGNKVSVIYTSGHWIDIDSLEDLVKASHF